MKYIAINNKTKSFYHLKHLLYILLTLFYTKPKNHQFQFLLFLISKTYNNLGEDFYFIFLPFSISDQKFIYKWFCFSPLFSCSAAVRVICIHPGNDQTGSRSKCCIHGSMKYLLFL